jgi:hypothetical protein
MIEYIRSFGNRCRMSRHRYSSMPPGSSLQLIRRFRIPALFCALAVLVCELISRPYTTMGICDDGPYILVAKNLAATGHIHYNGWSAAMLCWQLYLGVALIKLFGFSFTIVRVSTLLVSMAAAFLLQRTLARCGISERNAVIGTLALVLSPLYLLLSATFMSDVHGLFAMIICLYACLRALQASTERAAIGWLCFAIVANVACGTSRQLAWLGVLVMVPCTLWLLRAQRRVFLAGVAATAVGVLAIFACLNWLKHQPYTTPEKFGIGHVPWLYLSHLFIRFFLEFPLLLFPITALFLLAICKCRPRTVAMIVGLLGAFYFLVVYPSPLRSHFAPLLEPTLRDYPGDNWVTILGEYESVTHGTPAVFLPLWMQGLLSVVSFGGVIGLMLSFFGARYPQQVDREVTSISWKQLGVLLGPFAAAYLVLLVYRTASVANDNTGVLFDRYALGLLLVALICLVREFQERVQPRFSLVSAAFIVIMAVYGAAITHNTFALYRARVAMADELSAAHVPYTSVDNGWEYNVGTELQYVPSINNPDIASPVGTYIPMPPLPAGTCTMIYHDETPHIQPLYGVSFDPKACYGPAPFAPVHYSRWLASQPGTLYAIKYRAPSGH